MEIMVFLKEIRNDIIFQSVINSFSVFLNMKLAIDILDLKVKTHNVKHM